MTTYIRGAYKGEIVNQGLSTSSGENPQIWLQVKILESIDHPEQAVKQYERMIYWTITDGTVDFVIEKLERLGFAGDSFRTLDPNAPNHHSFVGQEVDLFCKIEEYDGKQREKWDLSRGVSAPQVKPLDDNKARQLDALFGKKLKEKFRRSAKAPAKTKPVANSKEAEKEMAAAGDEIPF